MASKKIPIGLNPAEAELEHRVEVMMEPVKIKVVDHTDGSTELVSTAPEPTPAVEPTSVPLVAAPAPKPTTTKVAVTMHDDAPAEISKDVPIDIFSDPKTAPAVPADLLKKLTASTKDEPLVEPVAAAEDKPEAATEPIVELPPPPPSAVVNRVPQLIASTAPKPQPAAITEVTPPVAGDALATLDAAPEFETDNTPSADFEGLDIPPAQLDDAKTEAALAAITASESDQLLAAQDAARDQLTEGVNDKHAKPSRQPGRRKLWLIPLILISLLVIALAVPFSRYKLAGLVVKQTVQLQIIDSKTGRPVTKAAVVADGQSGNSDASGKVEFRLPVGTHTITVNKQYYSSAAVSAFAGFKAVPVVKVQLVATGRQVPISVTNALTGKPLAGVEISLSQTSAKTDGQGKAVIVLPAGQKTLSGTISAPKFNSSTITVQITDAEVAANSFKLVPGGSVYVLSNSSGTIDIVKTNLDGSKPTVVLKGTGKEDVNTTVLLASHDWQYLVLKAQRDSSQAALYLLDTSTDKLVQFDSGDANFTAIGWDGHSFMYDAVRNNVATSQNAHEQIKSYDAERGQLNQLDATQAATATTGFSYQGFYNFNIVGNLLIYNSQWYSSGGADISTKNATIRGVQSNGQNKKDYQTIPGAGLAYIQAAQATPQSVYYAVFNYNDNKSQYYAFQNQSVSQPSSVTAASFNKTYPAYVGAPGAKQTIWNETRDGKQVFMVGDANAASAHVISSLTGYKVYGWYGDDYLLVSKSNSQLFIVPVGGSPAPLALTNYYKPGQNVVINSYGYGGL